MAIIEKINIEVETGIPHKPVATMTATVVFDCGLNPVDCLARQRATD